MRSFSWSDVVDDMRASFQDALARKGPIERDVLIADHLVRLRFAGAELVDAFEPPLAHLLVSGRRARRAEPHGASLDAASTGTHPIPLPPGARHAGDSGIRYHGEDGSVVVHVADATMSVVDAGARAAWHYVPDATVLLWHQKAAPLRAVVHAWAGGHGLVVVHAAAVGRPEGGVLIVGTAGSGKSTTSLACLRAGFGFAGDDYVLVDPDRPFVHSLYSSAKLEWSHLDRHPELFGAANARTDAKALAFLAHDVPEQIVSGFEVLAVVLPRVGDHDDTRAVATTAANALLRLAPSTILQTPGRSQSALGSMARLVQELPAFQLELGTDLSTIPEALDAVIRDTRGP